MWQYTHMVYNRTKSESEMVYIRRYSACNGEKRRKTGIQIKGTRKLRSLTGDISTMPNKRSGSEVNVLSFSARIRGKTKDRPRSTTPQRGGIVRQSSQPPHDVYHAWTDRKLRTRTWLCFMRNLRFPLRLPSYTFHYSLPNSSGSPTDNALVWRHSTLVGWDCWGYSGTDEDY